MKKLKNIIEYILTASLLILAITGLFIWILTPVTAPAFFAVITNQYLFLLGYIPLVLTLLVLAWITSSRK